MGPLGTQDYPLGTQGLPQQKEETSQQGTQEHPRQKEETSPQMKHIQQEEPPLLSENQPIGNRQMPQIQQRFLPANVLMRVAALSTMVGANVLTSRRTSTGGGSPQSLTSQQVMFQESVAMQELPSKSA